MRERNQQIDAPGTQRPRPLTYSPGLPSGCRLTYLYLTEQPYGFVLDVLTDLPASDSSSATFT